MATKKQKEELMQTLKFTPIRARILIQGYGGECYIGSVPREMYEFFKSKQIDIAQYASNWDDDMFSDVPEDMRPFSPGSPYDCDNLFHASGATMDDSSRLTVINDDTDEDIFETSLEIGHLENQGIEVGCGEDFESADLEPGSVVFWGGQGEKGCFFDGEITLRAPFDPAKLRVTYGNGDDWYLSTGVEYDGEEIDGYNGYSTNGKWVEHKFWIVGDEEVYEGRERNEDEEEEDVPVLDGEEMQAQEAIDNEPKTWEGIPLTPWWPDSQKPVREGEYEVILGTWPFPLRAHWDGVLWKQGDQPVIVNQWRGLSQPLE
jgi:hypothetical protein